MGDHVGATNQGGMGREAWSGFGQRTMDDKQALARQEEIDSERNAKRGCWSKFSECFCGMWQTSQMNRHNDDREVYVRTTLRELVVYLLFLTILCIMTFGATSPSMYYFTTVLNTLFTTVPLPETQMSYPVMVTTADLWLFLQSVFLDGVYWEFWYDTAKTGLPDEDKNIYYENRLMGVPRLRQLQVRNDSCTVHPDFQNAIRQCYSVFSDSALETRPFGLMNGTAWTYHTADELGNLPTWGLVSTYSGGGYFQDLNVDKNKSTAILETLRKNLWITRGTRVLFIDFTVYNANVNLFCIIKFMVELPATGGLIPSATFRTVKLLPYVNAMDYFVLACQFIFCIFIVYYMVEEILEMKMLKCAYFKSVWNLLDCTVIVLALICIGFSVYNVLTISDKLSEILRDPTDFASFEKLGYEQVQIGSCSAVGVFFAWLKLFKYISFNKTMTQLSSTLSRCAKDVAGFAVMFFIVFFAYAQLGYLIFGTQVDAYRTFITSCFTLLRTILGDFDFNAMENANRVLGPIFFLTYVFFVFFVLLNMFLAIINDTYAEVKAEIAMQRNEFEIADYFKRGYNNMLGKLGKRDKLLDVENALKLSDSNARGQLTFDEIRLNLKKCNFSDMEIEMFFAKYDLDGDKTLEVDEVKLMLKDLEGQRLSIEKQISNPKQEEAQTTNRPVSASGINTTISGVSFEEFSVLQRRVDRLENSIGSIVSKIDAVLVKLDGMEKSKSKRRDTMSKILDTITENDQLDEEAKRKQMEQLVRNEISDWDGAGKK